MKRLLASEPNPRFHGSPAFDRRHGAAHLRIAGKPGRASEFRRVDLSRIAAADVSLGRSPWDSSGDPPLVFSREAATLARRTARQNRVAAARLFVSGIDRSLSHGFRRRAKIFRRSAAKNRADQLSGPLYGHPSSKRLKLEFLLYPLESNSAGSVGRHDFCGGLTASILTNPHPLHRYAVIGSACFQSIFVPPVLRPRIVCGSQAPPYQTVNPAIGKMGLADGDTSGRKPISIVPPHSEHLSFA